MTERRKLGRDIDVRAQQRRQSGMRTASELESAYARMPVRLAERGKEGSGVLSLAGRATELQLSSPDMIDGREGGTGWFDLVLEERDGQKILLHNSLTTSTGGPRGDLREWEFRIFPNIVVLNAGSIAASGRVREITFTAESLEDVFYYELTEWHSLYKAPDPVMKQMKALRDLPRPYPRAYPYFSPSEIYFVHNLPRVLREKVGDRHYEVHLGHRESHGRQKLTIEAVAFARIRFAQPVPIDEALDAAWAWRRFFHQLAMRPLAFMTMTCRNSNRRREPSSDLYLPNLDHREVVEERDMFAFSPRDIPYGQWRHRKKLAGVMRRWLELDGARRLFRLRVDRVLEAMRESHASRLVADLCAAVESLTELRAPSTLADADLMAMVDAASAAGAGAAPPVPRDRIEGLLALLHHQSLPQRLKALAKAIETAVPKKDAQAVIGNALRLRKFEAHGDHWDEMTMPRIGPTLELLASMCVLWDLTTAGMPVSFDDRRLSASSRAHWFAQEMRH